MFFFFQRVSTALQSVHEIYVRRNSTGEQVNYKHYMVCSSDQHFVSPLYGYAQPYIFGEDLKLVNLKTGAYNVAGGSWGVLGCLCLSLPFCMAFSSKWPTTGDIKQHDNLVSTLTLTQCDLHRWKILAMYMYVPGVQTKNFRIFIVILFSKKWMCCS